MEFKQWLKYFGLNFFDRSIASESKKRSVWNGILAFCISMALMYGALCVGTMASFSTHYKNSSDFTEFYREIFNGSDGIKLKISDRTMSAFDGDGDLAMINTFANSDDREIYSKNGYDLIIDTRDCESLYSDFEARYINTSDASDIISYDEYQKLSVSAKSNYYAKLILSENAIVFTDDLVAEYAEYINSNGDSDDVESLKALDLNDTANYSDIYELFYKVKYSGLGTGFSTVPTVRDYYINTYLATDANGRSVYDNYVIFLYDLAFASWHTDDGMRVVATGFYSDEDVEIYDNEENADRLLGDLYQTNSDVIKINYFLYMLRAISLVGLIWIIVPLLFSICSRIFKRKVFPGYTAVFKTIGGFWMGSTVPAIIFAVCASFKLSQASVFYMSIGIIIIIDIFRTLLQMIPDIVHSDKTLDTV